MALSRQLGLALLFVSAVLSAAQLDPRAPWPMPGANVGRTGQATLFGPAIGPGTTIGIKWIFVPFSFPKPVVYYDSPVSIAASGNVYANSGSGTVYCINATTGIAVWSSVLRASFPATGTAIGPAAVFSASKGMSLYAINATNWTRIFGKQLWSYATSTSGYSVSSPLLRLDNVLVVGAGDGSVHAVDAATGARVWNSTLPTAPYGATAPAVDATGNVFVTTLDGTLYGLAAATGMPLWRATLQGKSQSGPVVSALANVVIVATLVGVEMFDAATGARRWAHTLAAGVSASPAISTSSVYVAAWDGSLYALDLATGDLLWAFPVPSGATLVSSPILDASNSVYFGAREYLYCINGSTGALQWSFPLPDASYIFAPPSIGLNGTLVVTAVSGEAASVPTFGRVFALQAVPAQNASVALAAPGQPEPGSAER